MMTGQNQTKEEQNQTKETEGNPSMCLTRAERREARRRLLAARFYYWTEVRRRRFDDGLPAPVVRPYGRVVMRACARR